MITREFLTAGNALFTIEPAAKFVAATNCNPHYTFKIVHKPASDRWPESWLVCMLIGPDNENDYVCVAKLDARYGHVNLTRNSKLTPATTAYQILQRVVARIFAGEQKAIEDAGWKVHHEGRCGRCGRTLTVPESIESGIGPDCASRMRAA